MSNEIDGVDAKSVGSHVGYIGYGTDVGNYVAVLHVAKAGGGLNEDTELRDFFESLVGVMARLRDVGKEGAEVVEHES